LFLQTCVATTCFRTIQGIALYQIVFALYFDFIFAKIVKIKSKMALYTQICSLSQTSRTTALQHISSIKLTQFRNYSSQSFDLNAKVVAISGNNGVGKTNLLDAIYY